MDQTVQVCIVTLKQIRRRRGWRGIRSPLAFPIEQFRLCAPVCATVARLLFSEHGRVWFTNGGDASAGSPILEPDLSLTLLHAQQLADLSPSRRRRTPVHAEESFEVNELIRRHPRPLSFLPLSSGAPTAAAATRRRDATLVNLG
jgi:hypothetical protein